MSLQTVICEYQQGNFVRSPEVKFQIYKISNIDITDLCEVTLFLCDGLCLRLVYV